MYYRVVVPQTLLATADYLYAPHNKLLTSKKKNKKLGKT